MSERLTDPALTAAIAGDLRVLLGKLRRRLREHTEAGDLSWSQVAVLGHIEREGPATVTALAKLEGVRPQSMGATVQALEAAGLVVGAPHPTDGRQTLISLTDACREWIRASRAAREDWLGGVIQARLDADEQRRLAEALVLLRRIVD